MRGDEVRLVVLLRTVDSVQSGANPTTSPPPSVLSDTSNGYGKGMGNGEFMGLYLGIMSDLECIYCKAYSVCTAFSLAVGYKALNHILYFHSYLFL